MNIANIKYNDIANGPGVRTTIFVSGCTLHCENCFNKVAWDFNYGTPFDKETRNAVLESLAPGYVTGLTVLGGEPFEPQNQEGIVPFLKNVRVLYPNKSIWCFSGYVLDRDIMPENGRVHTQCTNELLSLADVLVDGPFIEAQHDITLRFRGSSNQRIIDMKKTLAAGEIIPWQDEKIFETHTMD